MVYASIDTPFGNGLVSVLSPVVNYFLRHVKTHGVIPRLILIAMTMPR